MATGNHAADNFSEIWKLAKSKYEKDAGVHLKDHPFARQLERCQGRPKEISALFARETKALDKLSDNRMTTWCQNIADVLLTCSAMLNNGIGPVSNFFVPYRRSILEHPVHRYILPDKWSFPVSVFFFRYAPVLNPLSHICVTLRLTPTGNEGYHIKTGYPNPRLYLRTHKLLP